MKTIKRLLLCVFFVAAVLLLGSAEEKHWPDLSCHQSFENDMRASFLSEHRESWKQCQIRNNETGPCAKTCMLRAYNILYLRGVQKWVCFGGSEASKYFMGELGLAKLSKEEWNKQNVSKVIGSGLDACGKKWGARYIKDRDIMAPCEVWADIIGCLEDAYGCSSKGFKNE